MPYIINENQQIYYEIYGNGIPIVLTYGLGGSTNSWKKQTEDLAANYQIILWDQRGEGYSDCPKDLKDFYIENSVEDLRKILDELKIDSAIIGGQSLGGGVSVRFALKYPERVKALVICNSHSASGLPAMPEMKQVRKKTLQMYSQGIPFDDIVNYLIGNEPNLISRYVYQNENRNLNIMCELKEMFNSVKPSAYFNMINAMKFQDDISSRLEELKMPVLLLTGDRDPSKKSMEYIAKKIPKCTFNVISNAGHHSNIDNPSEFNYRFVQFVRNLQ